MKFNKKDILKRVVAGALALLLLLSDIGYPLQAAYAETGGQIESQTPAETPPDGGTEPTDPAATEAPAEPTPTETPEEPTEPVPTETPAEPTPTPTPTDSITDEDKNNNNGSEEDTQQPDGGKTPVSDDVSGGENAEGDDPDASQPSDDVKQDSEEDQSKEDTEEVKPDSPEEKTEDKSEENTEEKPSEEVTEEEVTEEEKKEEEKEEPEEVKPLSIESFTASAPYAVAGLKPMNFSVKLTGGVAPCDVHYTISLGEAYLTGEHITLTEGDTVSFEYLPQSYGVHSIALTVTDSTGAQQNAALSMPVALGDSDDVDTIMAAVALGEDLSANLAAVASSQIGAGQNKLNFIIDEAGAYHYYTRFGEHVGEPYADDWKAAFITFCLNYAGVSRFALSRPADIASWYSELSAMGLVKAADSHALSAGDIVLFGGEVYNAGIVDAVYDGYFTAVLPGTETVGQFGYNLSDPNILGFVSLKPSEAAPEEPVEEPTEEPTEEEPAEPEVLEPLYLDIEITADKETVSLGETVTLSAVIPEGVNADEMIWQWQIYSARDNTWLDIDEAWESSYSFTADMRHVLNPIRVIAQTMPVMAVMALTADDTAAQPQQEVYLTGTGYNLRSTPTGDIYWNPDAEPYFEVDGTIAVPGGLEKDADDPEKCADGSFAKPYLRLDDAIAAATAGSGVIVCMNLLEVYPGNTQNFQPETLITMKGYEDSAGYSHDGQFFFVQPNTVMEIKNLKIADSRAAFDLGGGGIVLGENVSIPGYIYISHLDQNFLPITVNAPNGSNDGAYVVSFDYEYGVQGTVVGIASGNQLSAGRIRLSDSLVNHGWVLFEKDGNTYAHIPLEYSAIYVDGLRGNDNNSGASADSSVRSLRRVQELLRLYGAQGVNTVYVRGTVSFEAGSLSMDNGTDWNLSYTDTNGNIVNAVALRAENWDGPMFRINGGSHTLSFRMDGGENNSYAVNHVEVAGGTFTAGSSFEYLNCSGSPVVLSGGSVNVVSSFTAPTFVSGSGNVSVASGVTLSGSGPVIDLSSGSVSAVNAKFISSADTVINVGSGSLRLENSPVIVNDGSEGAADQPGSVSGGSITVIGSSDNKAVLKSINAAGGVVQLENVEAVSLVNNGGSSIARNSQLDAVNTGSADFSDTNVTEDITATGNVVMKAESLEQVQVGKITAGGSVTLTKLKADSVQATGTGTLTDVTSTGNIKLGGNGSLENVTTGSGGNVIIDGRGSLSNVNTTNVTIGGNGTLSNVSAKNATITGTATVKDTSNITDTLKCSSTNTVIGSTVGVIDSTGDSTIDSSTVTTVTTRACTLRNNSTVNGSLTATGKLTVNEGVIKGDASSAAAELTDATLEKNLSATGNVTMHSGTVSGTLTASANVTIEGGTVASMIAKANVTASGGTITALSLEGSSSVLTSNGQANTPAVTLKGTNAHIALSADPQSKIDITVPAPRLGRMIVENNGFTLSPDALICDEDNTSGKINYLGRNGQFWLAGDSSNNIVMAAATGVYVSSNANSGDYPDQSNEERGLKPEFPVNNFADALAILNSRPDIPRYIYIVDSISVLSTDSWTGFDDSVTVQPIGNVADPVITIPSGSSLSPLNVRFDGAGASTLFSVAPGGQLTLSATVENCGTAVNNAGTASVSATVRASGTAIVNSGTLTVNNSSLSGSTAIENSGSGSVYGSGNSLTASENGIVNSSASESAVILGGSLSAGSAAIVNTAGKTAFEGDVSSTGLGIDLDAGTVNVTGNVTATGKGADMEDGTLYISGDLDSGNVALEILSGTATVDGDVTAAKTGIDMEAGTLTVGGSITAEGGMGLDMESGSATVHAITASGKGAEVNSGTLTVTGNVSANRVGIEMGSDPNNTLTYSGEMNVTGGSSATGIILGNGTANITNSKITVSGGTGINIKAGTVEVKEVGGENEIRVSNGTGIVMSGTELKYTGDIYGSNAMKISSGTTDFYGGGCYSSTGANIGGGAVSVSGANTVLNVHTGTVPSISQTAGTVNIYTGDTETDIEEELAYVGSHTLSGAGILNVEGAVDNIYQRAGTVNVKSGFVDYMSQSDGESVFTGGTVDSLTQTGGKSLVKDSGNIYSMQLYEGSCKVEAGNVSSLNMLGDDLESATLEVTGGRLGSVTNSGGKVTLPEGSTGYISTLKLSDSEEEAQIWALDGEIYTTYLWGDGSILHTNGQCELYKVYLGDLNDQDGTVGEDAHIALMGAAPQQSSPVYILVGTANYGQGYPVVRPDASTPTFDTSKLLNDFSLDQMKRRFNLADGIGANDLCIVLTFVGVFIDTENGKDSNDGLSYLSPVQTFSQAAQVMNAQDSDFVPAIYVVNKNNPYSLATATVSGDDTLDVDRNDVYVTSYHTSCDTLVKIPAGASLTVTNASLDGQGNLAGNETAVVLDVQGTFTSDSNVCNATDTVIKIGNGGEVNLNDSTVKPNDFYLSTATGVSIEGSGVLNLNKGSTVNEGYIGVNMNGGTLNVASGASVTQAHTGIVNKSGTVNINGSVSGNDWLGVSIPSDSVAATLKVEGGSVSSTHDGNGIQVSSGALNTDIDLNSVTISYNDGDGIHVESGTVGTTLDLTGVENSVQNNDGIGISIGSGTVNMANTSVSNNEKGGIALSGGSFTHHSGTVSGNGLSSSSINSGAVGGISVSGGTYVHKSGDVSNNGSKGSGGGISVTGGSYTAEHELTVSGNRAGTNGGGIYAGPGSTVEFKKKITVTENYANNGHGGGIYWDCGALTLSENGAEIINNHANNGNGGGIYLAGSSLTHSHVFGDLFTINNNSARNGGAVYSNCSVPMSFTKALSGNYANGSGGTIYSAKADVSVSAAISSSAGGSGGVIYVGTGDLELKSGATLSGSAGTYGSGGLIYVASGDISVASDVTLNKSSAGMNGGVIYLGSGSLTMEDNTHGLEGSAGGSGGAIYVGSSASVTLGSTKVTGEAGQNGGAISMNGGSLTAKGSIIGTAENGDGGAICAKNTTLTLNGSSIHGVSGEGKGGAVCLEGGSLSLTGSTTAITGTSTAGISGTSKLDGGAVYAKNANVTLSGSSIDSKSTDGNGGAVAISGGKLTMAECTPITASAPKGSGGVVYQTSGSLDMSGCTSITSSAGNSGGVVYFSGSTADMEGIALAAKDGVSVGTSAGTGNGGAVYVNASGSVNLKKASLANSEATNGDGGAVYIANGKVDLTGADLSGSAAKNGGAVYLNSGSAEMPSGSFTGCTASAEGGTVYVNGGSVNYGGDTGSNDGKTVVYLSENGDFNHISGEVDGPVYAAGDYTITLPAASVTGIITLVTPLHPLAISDASTAHGDNTFTVSAHKDHFAGSPIVKGTATVPATTGNDSISDKNQFSVDTGGDNITKYGRVGNDIVGDPSTDVFWKPNTSGNDSYNGNNEAYAVRTFGRAMEILKTKGPTARIILCATATSTYSYNAKLNSTSNNVCDGQVPEYTYNGVTVPARKATIVRNTGFTGKMFDGVNNIQNLIISGEDYNGTKIEAKGGALVITAGCSVSNIDFCNHILEDGNSTLHVSDGAARISNCNFYDIKSLSSEDVQGVALLVESSSKATVSNCDFYRVVETSYGPVRVMSGNLEMTSCDFYDNSGSVGGIDAYASTVTLTSCNFTNNKGTALNDYSYYGGGGTFTVNNCTFTGNEAHTGAAIRSVGTLTVSNSTFTDNKASESGGAIYAGNGSATIQSNCTFKGNAALTGSGGAIYVPGGVTLTVNGGNFVNNSAATNGGAIRADYGSELNLNGVKFTGNTANNGAGGAVSTCNANQIENCVFEGNAANGTYVGTRPSVDDNATFAGTGGALLVYVGDPTGQPSWTITNCEFYNNTAEVDGGALYSNTPFTVSGGTFSGNEAKTGAGGAIYDLKANNTKNFSSVKFIDNIAATNGGAIYTTDKANISGGEYSGNEAKTGAGGAIYAFLGTSVIGGDFSNNTAGTEGGALYINAGTLTVGEITSDTRSTFKNNTATGNGGAVYADGATLGLYNADFSGNSAANGGAVYAPNAIGQSSVSTYAASSYGDVEPGVPSGTTGTPVPIENCSFNDNTASSKGGAVCLLDCSSDENSRVGSATSLNVSYSYFDGNTADDSAAICLTGDLSAESCSFTSNTATGSGKDNAIIKHESSADYGSSILISGCTIGNANAAAYPTSAEAALASGGNVAEHILWSTMDCVIENTKIMGNYGSDSTVSNDLFTIGSSSNWYGTINATSSSISCNYNGNGANASAVYTRSLTLNGSSVDRNSGNGWYVPAIGDKTRDLNAVNSSFSGNGLSGIDATAEGLTLNTMILKGCNLDNNGKYGAKISSLKDTADNKNYIFGKGDGDKKSSYSGNGITGLYLSLRGYTGEANKTEPYELTGIVISNNGIADTSGQGRGLHIISGANNKITLSDALISGNGSMSTDKGGGMYIGSGVSVTLADTVEFSKNTAQKGGAAYWNYAESNSQIENYGNGAKMIGNIADQGGAVYVDKDLALSGFYFGENEARQGGAIYVDAGASLEIQGATESKLRFIGNTADEGGAIYAAASNDKNLVVGQDTVFSDNSSNDTHGSYTEGFSSGIYNGGRQLKMSGSGVDISDNIYLDDVHYPIILTNNMHRGDEYKIALNMDHSDTGRHFSYGSVVVSPNNEEGAAPSNAAQFLRYTTPVVEGNVFAKGKTDPNGKINAIILKRCYFVDGVNGLDGGVDENLIEHDGENPAKAFKTVEHAMAVAAAHDDGQGAVIYICGTVTLPQNTNATWAPTDAQGSIELRRYTGFAIGGYENQAFEPLYGDMVVVPNGSTLTIGGELYALSGWHSANNSVTATGSIVRVENGGKLVIQDETEFVGNPGSADGSAIKVEAGGAADLTGLTVSAVSGANGGAIYAGGTVNVNSVSIDSASATNGGAVYVPAGGELNVNGALEVSGGSADHGNGGAVYNEGSVNVPGTLKVSGASADNGGAIYNAGNVNVTGTLDLDATAGSKGSAVYHTGKDNRFLLNEGAKLTTDDVFYINDNAYLEIDRKTANGVTLPSGKLNMDIGDPRDGRIYVSYVKDSVVGTEANEENHYSFPTSISSSYLFEKALDEYRVGQMDLVLSQGNIFYVNPDFKKPASTGSLVEGMSADYPFTSLAQAYSKIAGASDESKGGVIYVVKPIPVDGDMTISGTGYSGPDGSYSISNGSISIRRYSKPENYSDIQRSFSTESNKQELFVVNSGGTLTINDLMIDGHSNAVTTAGPNTQFTIAEGVEAEAPAITVNGGTLILGEGSGLSNNNSGANGIDAINNNGTVKVTGTTYVQGSVKLQQGKFITVDHDSTSPASNMEIILDSASDGRIIASYNVAPDKSTELGKYLLEKSVLKDYYLTVDGSNIVLRAKHRVYVDGRSGSDAADTAGTPDDPIRSLAEAYRRLQKDGGSSGTIYIVNTVDVNSNLSLQSNKLVQGDTSVVLPEGYRVTIKRYSKPDASKTTPIEGFTADSFTGALFNVASYGSLTVSGVTIDGHADSITTNNITETASGVKASGPIALVYGDMIIKDGAYLQNNNGGAMGGALRIAADGAVYVQDAYITGNSATYGAGAFLMFHGKLDVTGSACFSSADANAVQWVYPQLNGSSNFSYIDVSGQLSNTVPVSLPGSAVRNGAVVAKYAEGIQPQADKFMLSPANEDVMEANQITKEVELQNVVLLQNFNVTYVGVNQPIRHIDNAPQMVPANTQFVTGITADDMSRLPVSITVTVTPMGGTAYPIYEGSGYHYDRSTGTITVYADAVKGNINIAATALPVYSVTTAYTGVSDSGIPANVVSGTQITATISPSTGYILPHNITVFYTDGEALTAGTHYNYNHLTGEFTLYGDYVTGNITIEIVGIKQHSVNYTLTGGGIKAVEIETEVETEDGTEVQIRRNPEILSQGDSLVAYFEHTVGYEEPAITVTMGGSTLANGTDYSFLEDEEKGWYVLTIDSVTGDVEVTIDSPILNYPVTVNYNPEGSAVFTGPDNVDYHAAYEAKVSANEGYRIESVKPAELADTQYSFEDGTLTIGAGIIDTKLTVNIEAVRFHTVSVKVQSGSANSDKFGTISYPATIDDGKKLEVSIPLAEGYAAQVVSAKMGGSDTEAYTLSENGFVIDSVTGNVELILKAVPKTYKASVTGNDCIVAAEEEASHKEELNVTIKKSSDNVRLPETITVNRWNGTGWTAIDSQYVDYSQTAGTVKVDASQVTADIQIVVNGTRYYTVTYTAEPAGGANLPANGTVDENAALSASFTPIGEKKITGLEVTVNGAAYTTGSTVAADGKTASLNIPVNVIKGDVVVKVKTINVYTVSYAGNIDTIDAVKVDEGQPYNAEKNIKFTAQRGYRITGIESTLTGFVAEYYKGETAIADPTTAEALSGAVSYDKITADVTITVKTEKRVYDVTDTMDKADLEVKHNGTVDTNPTPTVTDGEENVTITIKPATGYDLPKSETLQVQIKDPDTGEVLETLTTANGGIDYNETTGEITIKDHEDIQGPITVMGTPTAQQYNVTAAITNTNYASFSAEKAATYGEEYSIEVTSIKGYDLPNNAADAGIAVTVNGQSFTDFIYTWHNKDSATITIPATNDKGEVNVTGNIHITGAAQIEVYDVYSSGVAAPLAYEGAANAIYGVEYSGQIKLADADFKGHYEITEYSITIGGKSVANIDENGSFTIPADKVDGNITVTATGQRWYTVTTELENATAGGVVDKYFVDTTTSGISYNLSAADGYVLPLVSETDNVIVKIGNNIVTSDAYTVNNGRKSGSISIAHSDINADVTITVKAIKEHAITYVIVDADNDGNAFQTAPTPAVVINGEALNVAYQLKAGYEIKSYVVIKTNVGAEVSNGNDGNISVANVTEPLTVTITTGLKQFDVEENIDNAAVSGSVGNASVNLPGTVKYGQDLEVTIVPDEGYKLPEQISVTVNGGEPQFFNVDPTTGKAIVPGSVINDGPIVIDGDAVPKTYTVNYDGDNTKVKDDYASAAPVQDQSFRSFIEAVAITGDDEDSSNDIAVRLPDTITVVVEQHNNQPAKPLTVGTGENAEYTYNPATGEIKIKGSEVNGDVTITANGVRQFAVNYVLNGLTADFGEGNQQINVVEDLNNDAKGDSPISFTLKCNDNVTMPEKLSVTIGENEYEIEKGKTHESGISFNSNDVLTIPAEKIDHNVTIKVDGVFNFSDSRTVELTAKEKDADVREIPLHSTQYPAERFAGKTFVIESVKFTPESGQSFEKDSIANIDSKKSTAGSDYANSHFALSLKANDGTEVELSNNNEISFDDVISAANLSLKLYNANALTLNSKAGTITFLLKSKEAGDTISFTVNVGRQISSINVTVPLVLVMKTNIDGGYVVANDQGELGSYGITNSSSMRVQLTGASVADIDPDAPRGMAMADTDAGITSKVDTYYVGVKALPEDIDVNEKYNPIQKIATGPLSFVTSGNDNEGLHLATVTYTVEIPAKDPSNG